MTGELMMLEVADDVEAWRAAGFAVVGDQMVLDGVEFRFTGSTSHESSEEDRGIRGWHLEGISSAGGDLDGLEHLDFDGPIEAAAPAHPNGISGIDHVVVATPHLARTIATFESAGLEARRSRTFRIGETERQQTFFWAGSTIIEMIGIVGEEGGGPATFWGLAVVSDDLDDTAQSLAGKISDPKDAIQPGRRIATIATRELGVSVPVAVMTPHPD